MPKRKGPSEEKIISNITDAGELPDWTDEQIADQFISEGEGWGAVVHHLQDHSDEPLPLELLAELLAWLEEIHGIRAVRSDNSEGRFEDWHHFVLRLVQAGYDERSAIEYVKGYFGLSNEYEDLKRRYQDYKKYLRKKTESS